MAFFVKYEFWYFFLKELHGRGIPVISFSAIFRESQPFFKWWGSLHRSMLHCFSHLFVQQEASKQLLKSIGMNHVSVCPDTRFDRVWAIANQASAIPIAEDFVKGAGQTLVLGSVWVSDIEVLAPVLRDADLKLIIAPHEIDEGNIEKILRLLKGRKIVRYSEAQNVEQYNTLIIDNIGMLSSLYQYGKMAYIGGGFEKGLHNTLEAAVYGLPLMIGPKYEKFQEAIDLVLLGAAFSVSNSAEAGKTIAQFLMDEYKRQHGGALARKYVQQHLGGTQKIMGFAKKYLKE
jgi:3-deoxy-D-manno-octulosonic-acid transferase